MTARFIQDAVRKSSENRAEWLDDIIAGLMAAAVKKDEIEIRDNQSATHTVVLVRGVPKYEWKLELH